MIKSSWAILLCKFSDDLTEPFPRNYYEDLFTASGVGSQNMVDFFRDVSHGNLDLSDTHVFSWYTLKQKRSEYMGSGANSNGRTDLLDWARQAAGANGDELSPYAGVVVCMNVETDLFGGGDGVVCGPGSTDPRYLGQEMGHFYGLDHSRAYGSTADYMDQWDTMSTARAFSAPHPRYSFIGPGLNAANMAGRGWLDESRVWQTSNRSFSTVVQLQPLHRHDSPGFLAARIGDYLVEFRSKEGWDAAIPQPAVLIHSFQDNQSYLISANNGEQDLVVGNTFGTLEKMSIYGSHTRIEVVEIDGNQRWAKVRLAHSPGRVPQYFEEDRPFRNPGVAWHDFIGRDDALLVVNGKETRLQRSSPLFQVLEQVAAYESHEAIASTQIRKMVRRETLSALVTLAENQMQTLQAFSHSVPAQKTQEGEGEQEV